MLQLPITAFTTAGFYFSMFLFLASAFLLLAVYYFRWKSNLVSGIIWSITLLGIACATWTMIHELLPVMATLCVSVLLVLCFYRLISTISLFGVFFLVSMILPAFYGIVWLSELVIASFHYFEHWLSAAIFITLMGSLGCLMIFNTVMLSWITLVRYSDLYFRFPRLKRGLTIADQSKKNSPFVSIHIPCFNEPPELVIETLNAISRFNYPHFEVIVLDNNTKDPTVWAPVEAHCLQLGERFRFYHIDKLAGAKAGALNACLKCTASQAELIAVFDADYVAKEDFLSRLVGFFDDPKIGFVQSCQDYRDWDHSHYQAACYYEYETHFKLELPGQNEWDVTYTIGTMCLIRRTALDEVGGWAEWCLTEDSEVAVRIHALGFAGYYLKETFGYGLIPETFESYKLQRFRWSAGPVQQIQKHWRLYLPWAKNGLSLAQKFGEIFHSLSIFFSESLSFLINIPILCICLWFAIVKQQSFILPKAVLWAIPIVFIKNILCNWLSIRLLGGSWKEYLLSALAARSLIFTRNVAFYKAWMSSQLTWIRTDKFKAKTSLWRAFLSCKQEIISAIIYAVIAVILIPFISFWPADIIFLIWLGIVNQIISFLCAPVMAFLSEKSIETSHIK